MLNPLWKIIILSILTLPLFGQQREVPIDQSTPVVSGTDVDSATSKVILELHKQIENLRESLQNQTSTDPEKSTKQLSELEAEFEKSIVGEDLVELYNEEEEQSTLEEEFMNILQPIFGAVKETTASLRAKEDLKVAIEK